MVNRSYDSKGMFSYLREIGANDIDESGHRH